MTRKLHNIYPLFSSHLLMSILNILVEVSTVEHWFCFSNACRWWRTVSHTVSPRWRRNYSRGRWRRFCVSPTHWLRRRRYCRSSTIFQQVSRRIKYLARCTSTILMLCPHWYRAHFRRRWQRRQSWRGRCRLTRPALSQWWWRNRSVLSQSI